MMRSLLFLLTIAFLLNTTFAESQDLSFKTAAPQTLIKEIKNKEGPRYDLIITLPSGYLPEKEYKVLYCLDWYKLANL